MRDQTPSEEEYTIDEALTSVKCGIFQVSILIFAGLSWLSEAMELTILSFIGPAIKSQWALSPAQESFLSTAVFFGMFVGSIFWGFISDSYGRRMAIRSMLIVMASSGLLSSFSPNYTTLLMLRCFLGFGVAGCHILQTWLMEFIPSTNRGAWVMLISVFWILGEMLEACIAWIIMPRMGWKWLLAISSSPSFLALIFSSIIPESPRYLYAHGRLNEAKEVLDNMARINKTCLPFGVLLLQETDPENKGSSNATTHLLALNKPNQFENLGLLFSSGFLRITSLLLILTFANNLLFYGNVLMISAVSSEENACGPAAAAAAANTTTNLYRNVFITSSAEIPGLAIATLVVDRLGRKITVEALTVAAFVSILPIAFHQKEALVVVALYLMRMFVYAVVNSLTLYGKEVYPTAIRNIGSGLAIAVGKIGGMICPLIAVGLVRGCHLTLAVIMFGAVIIASGICVLFLPVETKGKELSDVVN